MRAWMFSSVTSRAAPANASRSVPVHRAHRLVDRQRKRLDAEVDGQLPRVVHAAAARVRRRHQDAEHVRRSERFDGNRRRQR